MVFPSKTSARFFAFVSFILIIVSVFPIGTNLVAALEKRYGVPTQDYFSERVDGIIVLGGSIDQYKSAIYKYPVLNHSGSRVTQFLALARKFPETKLVFSGGSGSLLYQNVKESDIAYYFFEQSGLDVNRVTFEDKSRNTYENVAYSKELIAPQKNERWLLVTSAFHMPRAVAVFCTFDWPVIPYPTDHKTKQVVRFLPESFDVMRELTTLDIGMKEWIGLYAYNLFKRTKTFLPPPKSQDDNGYTPAAC